MQTDDLEVGHMAHRVFEPRPEHSAEAVGNSGVVVVSSASLIWFLETACGDAIEYCCGPDEVSVGVDFDLRHLLPSPIGQAVECSARVTGVRGNKIEFEVVARSRGQMLMNGTHRRAIVNLGQFLGASNQ